MQAAVIAAPLLLALTTHEAAHGWVARQLGDDTADLAGRVSFNPLRHVDLLGSLLVPLLSYLLIPGGFLLGWAKPLPVTFEKLRQRRRDTILVALAGPASNIVQAGLWWAAWRILEGRLGLAAEVAAAGFYVNLFVAAFNMLPIPPLDGSRILRTLLSRP